MNKNKSITGAELLVQSLSDHGVHRIASVAGESYLAVLDAVLEYPKIDVITCRQEGGAAFMAESWGKLTGKPGICFVTRGPGACNASIGIHTAMQDSTPLILFMGQVRREERGREAFQEIDVREVFGGLAKWATEIEDPDRIPEIIYRAFKTATSGRPGPVVIGLPEDMLRQETTASPWPPYKVINAQSSPAKISDLTDLLQSAERPLAIIGGSSWTDEACADFACFASACHLPVATAFRRQDLFDHTHNCYVGELGTGPNPDLLDAVLKADTLLVIGSRMGEILTQGYAYPPADQQGSSAKKQKLIHIHSSEAEIGKVYVPDLGIVSDMSSVAAALADKGLRIDGRRWSGWKETLRQNYLSWSSFENLPASRWDGADMNQIFSFLRKTLPSDAIVTTDAGNFSGWAQRYLHYGRPSRLLAPTSGAMGYATPSAIGASLACPDRLVLGLCGDGGFMMNGQELATAIHHQAKPIIMICNNNMFGTIRMHQERSYPGRISATALTNPDFVALAQSYGAYAARVDDADQFPAIWEEAVKARRPAVIEIAMDPRQLTTRSAL